MGGQNGAEDKRTGGVPEISKAIGGEAGGEAGGSVTGSGKGQADPSTSQKAGGGKAGGGAAGAATEKDISSEGQRVPGITEFKAPAPAKKKSSSSSKGSAANDKELKDNINLLLVGGFSLAAARFGAHWNISPDEANKITEPAVKIMDRLGASEFLGKYGDFLSLAVAAGIIVAPRVMITVAMEQAKGKEVLPNVGTSAAKPIKKGKADPGNKSNAPGQGASANGANTKATLAALDQ